MKKLSFIAGALAGFYAGVVVVAIAVVNADAAAAEKIQQAQREPKPGDPYPYPANLDSNITEFCGRRPTRAGRAS